MSEQSCDYCDRKATAYVDYEGLHRVCEKHHQIIFGLSWKGVRGIDFQKELEKLVIEGKKEK